MADGGKGFEKYYSEAKFWNKVKKYAKTAGLEVIEKALWLFYAFKEPDTPAWAKTVIAGALGYFILPIDAIPDVPPIGYTDDLGVLAAAVATVAVHITPAIKARVRDKLNEWFG